MTKENLYALKFPIGEFEKPEIISAENIKIWNREIAEFPQKLVGLTKNISNEQKNWRYRPDGWMLKQVVHHCADSHLNALMRFKLTITENEPTIKPYLEHKWAELPESLDNDFSDSLNMIVIIHRKLNRIIGDLTAEQLKRNFIHPEHGKKFSLEETVGVYAWHSNHHLEHLKMAIESGGKYN